MTENDKILPITNERTVDRTTEDIGAAWLRNKTTTPMSESQTPFWFTGPGNTLRDHVCNSLNDANERVFVSSSYLSEPSVVQSLSSAAERGVRVYVLLDKVGFEEILNNAVASPLHGRALIRERNSRGMDVVLCDWHLPSKSGMVLASPLDLTLSSSNGGWAMELDGEQIDEIQKHMTHEFWSTEGTREVLAAEEVANPPSIAEPPFVLKPLLNGNLVCRAQCSINGNDASSEDTFRTMKQWNHLSNGESTQRSVVLKGQLVEISSKAKATLYSTAEQRQPFTGAYAHSNASVLFAAGSKTFVAGWDRGSESDWGSLLMLNDQQKVVSDEWIQHHIQNAEWIGNDNLLIGDAKSEIIWNGRQMTVSAGQDVELGTITLENMPESEDEMKLFQPDFDLPTDKLARECMFQWTVRPPTLASTVAKDSLHTEWEHAKQVLNNRLSALDKVNQPPKIALFGRKIKALQSKLDEAISDLPAIRTIKQLVKMKDEVEVLSKNVTANAKAMDDAEVEDELEKAKEAQMKTHLAKVAKSENSVKQLTKKLKPLKDEHDDLTKQLSKSKKDEEQKRIKTDIETLDRNIAGIESELATATKVSKAEFVFKPPKENADRKKSAGHLFVSEQDGQLLPLDVPAEDLPETGDLFVSEAQRYLGIERWSQLDIAKKEAKRLKASIAVVEGA
jgi:predicted  nucleic acid-binding Zn-ribbon protein